MEGLKLLLIDLLKSQGMDPALIPVYMKALTSIITTEPGIDVVQVNQKLQALGWNEVTMDYHSLEIAMACLVAEAKGIPLAVRCVY